MSDELNPELQAGHVAAEALVAHMERMGGACMAVLPVSHVDHLGRLQEWEVTVKLIATIPA